MAFSRLLLLTCVACRSDGNGVDGPEPAPPNEAHDVVVVGAGSAGLYAAKTLIAQGYDVLILEATDRIGGRVKLAVAPDEEPRPRMELRPATPAERARVARLVAGEEIREEVVCRACALDLVERLVRASLEADEEDIRRRMKEQLECPN